MKHLSDGGYAAAEKDGHRPMRLNGHVRQEPSASARRAIQLFGEELDPLDNVELLLGVYECLEEERGRQLAGQQGDVGAGVLVLVERGGDVADHLPHEVEVGVVEHVVVLPSQFQANETRGLNTNLLYHIKNNGQLLIFKKHSATIQ